MITNPWGSAEILKQRDGLEIRQTCDGQKSAEQAMAENPPNTERKSAQQGKKSAVFSSPPLWRKQEF
jgi:hypothetical protein